VGRLLSAAAVTEVIHVGLQEGSAKMAALTVGGWGVAQPRRFDVLSKALEEFVDGDRFVAVGSTGR